MDGSNEVTAGSDRKIDSQPLENDAVARPHMWLHFRLDCVSSAPRIACRDTAMIRQIVTRKWRLSPSDLHQDNRHCACRERRLSREQVFSRILFVKSSF